MVERFVHIEEVQGPIPCARTKMTTKLPFSSFRKEGDFMFLSGQIGLKNGALIAGGIKEQTVQAAENINTILREQNLSLENVVDVVAFLVEQEDYPIFNEVYGGVFGEPFPTRTTVTVKSLPLGAKVELKVVARF